MWPPFSTKIESLQDCRGLLAVGFLHYPPQPLSPFLRGTRLRTSAETEGVVSLHPFSHSKSLIIILHFHRSCPEPRGGFLWPRRPRVASFLLTRGYYYLIPTGFLQQPPFERPTHLSTIHSPFRDGVKTHHVKAPNTPL